MCLKGFHLSRFAGCHKDVEGPVSVQSHILYAYKQDVVESVGAMPSCQTFPCLCSISKVTRPAYIWN